MAARRSILWIVTTQWRAQACGFAGDPNARTPCLDALAAGAVCFAEAVTPHPFGPFARAAMLTGIPSPENGVSDYFDPLPVYRPGSTETARWERARLGRRDRSKPSGQDACAPAAPGRTIAHELNDRGYATAFFGKWHLGRRDPVAPLVGEAHARTLVPPEARGGFSHWEGFESGFLLNDPWLHGTGIGAPQRFSGYQSDVLAERAARWLGAGAPTAGDPAITRPHHAADGAWFCVVSLEPPHPPYDAPAAGVRARSPDQMVLAANVPRGGEAERKARAELVGYHAHIEATDRAIGQLIGAADAAEAARGRPRPVVVCTSVHGDMHGAHGLFRKGWPHEESVRVPLLVRTAMTASTAAGAVSAAPVSLLDLPRWTLGWAEGRNDLADTPGDRAGALISMPSVVPLPHQCDRVWRGLRTPTRKLVLNADGSPWLLFDLANDPGEQRNLVAEPAWREELESLRRQLAAPAGAR